MNLARKIAFNFSFQFFGKIISIILSIIALGLLTRYLGQNGFGDYTTVITFVSFFAVFADLGLYLIITREISKNEKETDKITSNVFTLRTISNVLFFILGPLVTLLFPYSFSVKIAIIIASLAYFFISQNQVLVGIFQKKLRVDKIVISEIIGKIVFLALVWWIIKSNYGLWSIMSVSAISMFINFIITFIFSLKYVKIKLAFDFKYWKYLIKETLPLAISTVLSLIYFKSDILLLSILKTPQDVGIYGAPAKIMEVLTTFPAILLGLLFPLLSKYAFVDRDKFKKIYQNAFDILIIIILPLIFGTWFLSKPLIEILAGKEFIGSANVLKILMIATGIIFLAFLASFSVIALGKQKEGIKAHLVGGVLSLGLNLILIPRFSYAGAALTAVISQFFPFLILGLIVYKYTKIFPSLNILIKSILASIIMALFLFIFKNVNFWLLATLGGSVYLITLLILRGLPREAIFALIKPPASARG